MAVMHKETFQIYHEDQTRVPDGYVYIDELIAPTISVLNQKGYTTRFCCSGHPENDRFIIDKEEESGFRKGYNSLNAYIAFETGITLPYLPEGFEESQNLTYDRPVIRKHYKVENEHDNEYFEKARQILDSMKELYEWALTLPEFDAK
ncbi:MAG: hypothetical protein IJ497_10545 [Clostridia bacterium]|nr:hypothetical protein [Clostridia bacterium]